MSANKKAFELGRDSVYVAEPISDLCIVGGKGILPDDEAGDLDTMWELGMSLRDQRRLKRPLEPEFKANVAFHWVKVPIIIAKINDVATVVVGRRRVRAARIVNRARIARGETPLKIRCVMQRDTSSTSLLATMVLENNARQDDELADRIEKAKEMIEGGMSPADVAMNFSVKQATLQGWLDFEDTATDLTKQAVKDGRLSAATAAEVALVKEPEAQNKLLADLIAAPTPRGRTARAAKALRRGKEGSTTASDRKSQQLLLAHLQATDHPRAGKELLAFYEGAEQMLRLVLGEKDSDERLRNALSKAREATS